MNHDQLKGKTKETSNSTQNTRGHASAQKNKSNTQASSSNLKNSSNKSSKSNS